MSKILFFDIDGVIWSYRTYKFSQEACKNLNDLLEKEQELKVVISSSWRKHGIDECKKILDKNGVDSSRVIGITGNELGERGGQVQAWLDRNPGVTSFVILDDESDFSNLMDRLVKTGRYICLTADDVKKCLDILKVPV